MHTSVTDKENVVGTVTRAFRDKDGELTTEPCFKVLVKEKKPVEELSEDDIIPDSIDGKKTDVQEIGTPRLLSINAFECEYPNRDLDFNPLVGGIQISHEDRNASGTYGIGPFENEEGDLVGLTNQHVAAPPDVDPEIGDVINQPRNGERVGTLYDYYGPNSTEEAKHDHALIKLDDDVEAYSHLLGMGTLAGLKHRPFDEDKHQFGFKSGARSSVTTGLYAGDDADIRVRKSDDEVAEFKGVQMFTTMGMAGDSGSIICYEEDDGYYGFSLLFAGSSFATFGIPVDRILDVYGELESVNTEPPEVPDPFEEGYDTGYDEGHDDGYETGFDDGHEEGYEEGSGECTLVEALVKLFANR